MSAGMALIVAERIRQVEGEGFTAEHDREHDAQALVAAAVCYYWNSYNGWPWEPLSWKPKDHLSNLIRAGALYLAAADVRGETSVMADTCAAEIDEILNSPALANRFTDADTDYRIVGEWIEQRVDGEWSAAAKVAAAVRLARAAVGRTDGRP